MAMCDLYNENLYLNLLEHDRCGYIVQIGRVVPRPGYAQHKRGLGRHLIDYVVRGRGYVTCRGKTYPVGEGDLIYLRKGIDVDYGTDKAEPYEKLWLSADGPLIDAFAECYLAGEEMVIRKGSGEPFQKLMEILSSDNGGGKQQSMHVMLDLFMSLGRHSEQDVSGRGEHTGLAPKLRHYIDTHIAERFTLDDLAEHFHLSKRQLIRIFKAKYGETPGAYHCRTRLVAASRYLAETECTVGEVAARLGYCDQSFFSTAFKKQFGMYPLAWRAKNTI